LETLELFRGNAFYGMARILKEYSGLPSDRPLKVVIPHGLVFSPSHIWEAEVRAALPVVLCYPAYREAIYRAQTHKVVVPSASPFIYLLELLKTHREPSRQGTIFFPAHSTHSITAHADLERLAERLLVLDKRYQPVNVCVYWRDLKLGHHLPFQERGFRLVSAGHMFDPFFLARFYHLCSLHKYSASNAIGSNLFYSIKAGCSFFLIGGFDVTLVGDAAAIKRDTHSVTGQLDSSLWSLFGTPREQVSNEQLEVVDQLLGTAHFQSPEGLRRQLLQAEVLDKAGFVFRTETGRARLAAPAFFRRTARGLGRKLLSAGRRLASVRKSKEHPL
jgi:hypothetical protein